MSNRTYISLFRTYTDENGNLRSEAVNIGFDLINKVSIKSDLQVCTSPTIRGRDKTDHAYLKQKTISISGSFSERAVDSTINKLESLNNEDTKLLKYKIQGNKLKNLQNLFFSFLKDTRLFHVHTRFKTYKNYVLTSCSFSYGDSVSSVNFDLSFLEVMFRQNDGLYNGRDDFALHSTDMSPVTEYQVYYEGTGKVSSQGDKSIVDSYNKVITSVSGSQKHILSSLDMALGLEVALGRLI